MITVELEQGNEVLVKMTFGGVVQEFKITHYTHANGEGMYVLAYQKDDAGRRLIVWEKEFHRKTE